MTGWWVLSSWAFWSWLWFAGLVGFMAFMVLAVGMTSHGTKPAFWVDPTFGPLFIYVLPALAIGAIAAHYGHFRPWDVVILGAMIVGPILYTILAISLSTYKS
jgi:hypothetical protein